MLHPLLFFVGYRRMRISRSYAGEVLNLCQHKGYIYRDFQFEGDCGYFLCSYRVAKKLMGDCCDRGIPLAEERDFGLPALLFRYRRRWGIFVGFLLFWGIVFWSGQVVWSIRIDGNVELEEWEVIEQMELCGMAVGDRISSLDTGVIENRVLIESDTISWISINMSGTVAQVEIREFIDVEEEERYAAANLVAERWGVIEYFEEVRGNIAVDIGDVVSEGDLLVGGLYDVEVGGIRYTCARGKVFAKTERCFEEIIPLKYEKKEYTGRIKIEKYWIFFGKEGKIFGNRGNSDGSYDIIDTIEYWELPGEVILPVGIRTVRYVEYTITDAERTPAEAEELAYYRLRCQMEQQIPDGELVRKRLTASLDETSYVLRCTANYIENIARMKEIEVELFSDPKRKS